MSSVSSVPEEPTSVPATIIALLLMAKPSAATARPVKEFNSEMTTGMSAPPMGMTIAMPKNSASENITMNATMALWPVALNVSQPHRPRITSKIRPFRKFWPGKVCGFSNFPSSFRYAMMLPENDSEPMSVANSMGIVRPPTVERLPCRCSVLSEIPGSRPAPPRRRPGR